MKFALATCLATLSIVAAAQQTAFSFNKEANMLIFHGYPGSIQVMCPNKEFLTNIASNLNDLVFYSPMLVKSITDTTAGFEIGFTDGKTSVNLIIPYASGCVFMRSK